MNTWLFVLCGHFCNVSSMFFNLDGSLLVNFGSFNFRSSSSDLGNCILAKWFESLSVLGNPSLGFSWNKAVHQEAKNKSRGTNGHYFTWGFIEIRWIDIREIFNDIIQKLIFFLKVTHNWVPIVSSKKLTSIHLVRKALLVQKFSNKRV